MSVADTFTRDFKCCLPTALHTGLTSESVHGVDPPDAAQWGFVPSKSGAVAERRDVASLAFGPEGRAFATRGAGFHAASLNRDNIRRMLKESLERLCVGSR